MKKIFLAILLIFISANFTFVQGRELEVEYPEIGGYEITQITTSIPEYVRYIYFAIIGLSGLIALIVLVWAGFNYLISTGIPEKIKTAREQIAAAILGLIILFCSWLIVNTINPQLTLLQVTPLEAFIPKLSPGVYLCKKEVKLDDAWKFIREYETADSERRKEIKKELQSIFSDIDKHCIISRSAASLKNIVKKFRKSDFVYLVPLEEGIKREYFGTILFDEELFLGKTQLVVPQGRPVPEQINIKTVSSILAFRIITPPDEDNKVTLYEHVEYNYEGVAPGKTAQYSLKKKEWGEDWYGKWENIKEDLSGNSPQSFKREGYLIVILGKGDKYVVFVEPEVLRLDTYSDISEIKCDPWWQFAWRECVAVSAADSLQLISGELM